MNSTNKSLWIASIALGIALLAVLLAILAFNGNSSHGPGMMNGFRDGSGPDYGPGMMDDRFDRGGMMDGRRGMMDGGMHSGRGMMDGRRGMMDRDGTCSAPGRDEQPSDERQRYLGCDF